MGKYKQKRLSGEGSIRERKPGLWEARYSMGSDENGKRIHKSVYGNSPEEVQEKLRKVLYSIDVGTYIEPSKITFGEWMDIWFEEYKANYIKESTYDSYRGNIVVHIKPVLGKIPLQDLRPERLQAFYNQQLKHGRVDGTGGLSKSSVAKIHNIIHEALHQAKINRLVQDNASEATVPPTPEESEPRAMTPEDQDAFLDALKDEPLKVAYIMDIVTGLRKGELLALRWDDIDLKKGELFVRKTLIRVKNWQEGRYYLKVQDAPKTKSGFRKVPLNDAIVTLLKFHKHCQLEHKMAVMDRFNDRNLVFCTGTGNFVAPRFFLKVMHRVAKRAEIQDVNVHTLRRTFATRLMEAGESIVVVQKLLGHKKLNHTLLYLESQTKTNRDAVQKLNYVVEGIGY